MKVGKGHSFHGDTIEVMKDLILMGDTKVDYILTSPPYNMRGHAQELYNNAKSFNDNMTNEDYKAWLVDIFKHYDELLNEGGVVIFNLNYMSSRQNKAINIFKILLEIEEKTNFTLIEQICWKKDAAQPLPEGRLSRIWENVWVFIREDDWEAFRQRMKPVITGRYNYIQAPNNDGKNHVNKACFSSLMAEKLLRIFDIQKHHVVMDNFMGTHSTAIACERIGCEWIGIELDKETYDYGRDRVNNFIGNFEEASEKTLFNISEE